MSLLSAAFLWGLPLLAVPVAIHLLSRRRQAVVKWGAMQLLAQSSIRRRKIWRVDDLLLMLLRVLAVLALVLALARPLWHGSHLGGGASRDVTFVWDVSRSMGRVLDDKTSFERLLEQTDRLFDQLGPSDTLRGLVTVGRGEWLAAEPVAATGERKQELLEALKKYGATESSADWLACLSTALRAESAPRQRAKFVIAITDGQAEGWKEDEPASWENLGLQARESALPTSIEIYNVMDKAKPVENLAVDRLTTPRELLAVRQPFVVEAEIRNHGHSPTQAATLTWSLDDAVLGKSTVDPLDPGQAAKLSLKFPGSELGIHRVECRLERTDDLPGDNSQNLIVETIDHVPLLLVDDGDAGNPLETDRTYVLAALGQDGSNAPASESNPIFRVTNATSQELAADTLSQYRAIVFPNTPDLDDAALAKLTDFVRQGGGLWLCLGDRTSAPEFNRQFYRSGGGLAPWPIAAAEGDLLRREDFATIHPPFLEHPATTLLGDTARLDIDRAKVFRHFPLVEAPSRRPIPILLQSGTGSPLAIEGLHGRGRIIVQSLPLGVGWSNLPLTQAYVPLVHEWLWYLIQPTGVARNLQPGEPLRISLPANEHVNHVTLARPRGEPTPMTPFLQGDHWWAQSRQTQLPGRYTATIQIEGRSEATEPYDVVSAPVESNLEPWDIEQPDGWNERAGLHINPRSPLVMPADATGIRAGEPLWTMLLVVLAILLLTELWLVRRIADKRFAFHADSARHPLSLLRGLAAPFGIGRNR